MALVHTTPWDASQRCLGAVVVEGRARSQGAVGELLSAGAVLKVVAAREAPDDTAVAANQSVIGSGIT